MTEESGKTIHRDRRNDLAKEALDTGFVGDEDPYWLQNMTPDLRHHEGHDDLLDTAEELREDADIIKEAHARLRDGDFTGAEAAVYIARRCNRGRYEIRNWLDQEMPITEEP
jgi:hypothetical protein